MSAMGVILDQAASEEHRHIQNKVALDAHANAPASEKLTERYSMFFRKRSTNYYDL